MRFIRLIFSNFKRHKTRTILTILSIAVAFVLFSYLVAIRHAFDMGVSLAGANRLIVQHKMSLIMQLPQSYESRIEQIDGVADATEASWFGGIYIDERNQFAQIAVRPEEFLATYPEFVVPPAEKAAWLRTKTGAVAGRKLAEKFKWKIGDRIPIGATFNRPKQGNTWTFDLVGIYDGKDKETDTTQFFFRHDYLDENRLFGEGQTGWYYIRIKDPAHAETIAKQVDALFANSPAETKTDTEKAFIRGFAKQMGDIGSIVTAILSAVFFTILLVAGNTMAQAVRERTSELGVLKAIGFSDTQVLMFVLIESVLMAAIGGAIGIGLGWLGVSRGDPSGGAMPVFLFPTGDLVLAVILVVALGLITGAVPAIQALRLNAVDALRRE
jgi:putative ABC transport system permease protein